MTKIVFMGTPKFSAPILEGLHEKGVEVLFVVTQPDRKIGRGKKAVLTPTPVKEKALELGLKVLQPEKISGSEEMEILLGTDFDLIVTAAFGQFLPEKLLNHPKVGAINVHASLLPKYRGGAPIHYAVINGEKETGVTIMEMVKKMDAGDMIASRSLPILDSDDTGVLFEKLSIVGRDLLLEVFDDYVAGEIQPIPQNDDEATYSPNIQSDEEVIHWSNAARDVFNLIRGLHPFPVAHTTWKGQRLKIYEAIIFEDEFTGESGEVVVRDKKNLGILCGDGKALLLNTIQLQGKSKMKASEFLNGVGREMELGMKLGE